MIYIIFFIASLVFTYAIKIYANKKLILDIPNERSSHSTPTPRGGGVSIIVLFFIGLFYFKNNIESSLFYGLLCAIPIACISLLDDIYILSSKVRFMVQSLSALMALYCLGGVTHIDFIFFSLEGSWINILAVVIIVWLTNLYNFLDGIDGYAGSQALIVGLGLSFFLSNVLGLLIVSISLGFLVFNWDKASIFMGDVGSATLGFIFAIFALSDTSHGNIYLWLVMLSLFWFDATVTLLRRFLNGESITKAHNKHAYQRLVQSGWSHGKVVLYALSFNLLFLFLFYFIKDISIVFLLNIIFLLLILKFIETKKSFR